MLSLENFIGQVRISAVDLRRLRVLGLTLRNVLEQHHAFVTDHAEGDGREDERFGTVAGPNGEVEIETLHAFPCNITTVLYSSPTLKAEREEERKRSQRR